MAIYTPPKQRIGDLQGNFMLGTAVTIDFLQGLFGLFAAGTLIFVPVSFTFVILAWSISFLAALLFSFWLLINGVSPFGLEVSSGRYALARLVAMGVPCVIKIIPGFSFFPAWMFGIAFTLYFVRKEDKQRYAAYQKEQEQLQRQFRRVRTRMAGFAAEAA